MRGVFVSVFHRASHAHINESLSVSEPEKCRYRWRPLSGGFSVRQAHFLKGKDVMNNQSVIPAFDFREMVMPSNGKVITTSMKIARYFGKAHKNVLRTIKRLESDCTPDFNRLNFEPVEYLDKKGELRLMYNITKDGWMMLVMGFTGKAATAIKEQYIAAFNWMAERLSRRLAMGEEMQHRYVIKETRSKLKGTIGSMLMNERKKEKRVLALEHEHIMQVTQPELLIG